ncbi:MULTISPECIES: hypothetical protein [Duganella]|jgi:hypothetical protein|uniref:hypothetical protein n=1 Tax=Duganella TaxID=75654 RepID=UPI00159EB2A6
MAKTNFAYEKRQRELEKKKKAEEKARRKAELKQNPGLAEPGELDDDGEEAGDAAPAEE